MKLVHGSIRSRLSHPNLSEQSGFTLIEMMWVLVIMSILSALSFLYLRMYMQDAEYSKAESMLRNARTAIEAGDQDNRSGAASMAYTVTGVAGGLVPPAMEPFLPGATTAEDVRLGAQYNPCANQPGLTVNQLLISQPCNSDRYTRYTKFCNGIEVMEMDIAKDYAC